jgi:hypothetical protein
MGKAKGGGRPVQHSYFVEPISGRGTQQADPIVDLPPSTAHGGGCISSERVAAVATRHIRTHLLHNHNDGHVFQTHTHSIEQGYAMQSEAKPKTQNPHTCTFTRRPASAEMVLAGFAP